MTNRMVKEEKGLDVYSTSIPPVPSRGHPIPARALSHCLSRARLQSARHPQSDRPSVRPSLPSQSVSICLAAESDVIAVA